MLGTPCDHNGALDFGKQHMTRDDAVCGGELCAFASYVAQYEYDCVQSADCSSATPEDAPLACEADICVPTDPYILERSMCATACESDADCKEVAADSNCASGFVCAHFPSTCCKNYCLCADDVLKGIAAEGKASCEDEGPEPGCPG